MTSRQFLMAKSFPHVEKKLKKLSQQLLLNFSVRISYFELLKVKFSETMLLTFFGKESLGIERNKYFEPFQGIEIK